MMMTTLEHKTLESDSFPLDDKSLLRSHEIIFYFNQLLLHDDLKYFNIKNKVRRLSTVLMHLRIS